MLALTYNPLNEYQGIYAILKKYQVMSLDLLVQAKGDKLSSRQVHERISSDLIETGETISRASIINFLNEMVDLEVILFDEVTSKGGYKRIYYLYNIEDGWNGLRKRIGLLLFKTLLNAVPTLNYGAIQRRELTQDDIMIHQKNLGV